MSDGPGEGHATPAQPLGDPQVTRVRSVQPPPEGELRILNGPGAGSTVALVGGSATIGREPECDLQVLDSEVSRLHAKVTVRDGVAAIDDLHSSNGTYVDGERILARTTLAPGDRIQIGEATIELTSPVFAGASARVLAPQVSSVREVLSQFRGCSPRSPARASGGRWRWC